MVLWLYSVSFLIWWCRVVMFWCCTLSLFNLCRSKSSAKRHSFTSVLGVVQLRPNQENRTNGPSRHSMEISPPELVRSSNPIAATLLEARQQGPTNPPISSSPSATAVTTVTTTTTQETGSRTNRKKPPPLAAVPQVSTAQPSQSSEVVQNILTYWNGQIFVSLEVEESSRLLYLLRWWLCC